jgi:hypothetical protein
MENCVLMFHSCQRLLVTCLLPLQLFVGSLLFIGIPTLSEAAENAEERSRFCQGFLYCRETKGEATSTQAFLYLYSRLTIIPFYSREMNPVQGYLRQSVLWPLGISERKADASYFQLLPVYWHAEDPSRRYTVFLPAYFDYAEGDQSYTYLVPLYGHHQRGDHYHRYYLLGPVAIATYDTQTDLREWDILFPLFHYGADQNGYETRVLPLYFSGKNNKEGTWYRYLLPFYGQSVTLRKRVPQSSDCRRCHERPPRPWPSMSMPRRRPSTRTGCFRSIATPMLRRTISASWTSLRSFR